MQYSPRETQKKIHEVMDRARFTVLVAHRRMGKTVMAVNQLIRRALICPFENGHYGYVAPFRNQAKSIAWRYLHQYTSEMKGRIISESELSITLENNAKIRLFGADNPDALRGMYFDGLVLDEVAQMRPYVWEEILRPTLADRNGWAVFIGTPHGVNLFHELYMLASQREASGSKEWAALLFRAEDTGAIPTEELAKIKEEMGESTFRQEFLCDFNAANDDVLISPSDVYDAVDRGRNIPLKHSPFNGSLTQSLILGVDVARFGNDATVIIPRCGMVAGEPIFLRNLDNMVVADHIADKIRSFHPVQTCIDAGGGAGVIDRLRHMGFCVVEIPFGSRALETGRFVNRRTEMWWNMAKWIKSGGIIPDVKQLRDDLCTPSYSFDEGGKIKLESKDAIRLRLGRSPDAGDALALTFSLPAPECARPVATSSNSSVASTEYDVVSWA